MKLLKSYIQTHSGAAIKQLHLFCKTQDEEALHQFRVNGKKLRAVLQLLLHLYPENKKLKKLRKGFRIFFRSAGEIREQQLVQQWLKQKRLQQLITTSVSLKQVPVWQGLFVNEQKDCAELIQKLADCMKQLSDDVNEEIVFNYINLLKATVIKKLPFAATDEWHELRKQIKQLLYGYHWLSPAAQLKIFTIAAFKKSDELQDQIGQWHDLINYKSWLNTEGFYMNEDAGVQKQFARCYQLLRKEIEKSEIKLQSSIRQFAKRKTAIKK
ncbi:MAG: CHAD domain-containing protein [Chitinophagaceae bacterium]|nr:CHAD domain-containing protein [Chitinophagaceae bacterium]